MKRIVQRSSGGSPTLRSCDVKAFRAVGLFEGIAAYLGPVTTVFHHRKSCHALVVGLDGEFILAHADGRTRTVRWALIPARHPHRFEFFGGRSAIYFVAPDHPTFLPLRKGLNDRVLTGRHFGTGPHALPDPRDFHALIAQNHSANAQVEPTFGASLLASATTLVDTVANRYAASATFDARLRSLAGRWRDGGGLTNTVRSAADHLGLSESRLTHLATDQLGGFKRAQAYYRCLRAVKAMATGQAITDAAHTAGFSDGPHLTRTFRTLFGSPPSVIAQPSTEVVVSKAADRYKSSSGRRA